MDGENISPWVLKEEPVWNCFSSSCNKSDSDNTSSNVLYRMNDDDNDQLNDESENNQHKGPKKFFREFKLFTEITRVHFFYDAVSI